MSDHVETVRETLNAAFEAAETAPPPPPRPVSRETRPQTSNNSRNSGGNGQDLAQNEPESAQSDETVIESHEPAERPETGVNRPRDQFGRFTSATPEGPARTEPEPEPLSDQPEAEPPEQAPETSPGPAILAPQSWSAAAKDHWHQLPRPIQEEVARRERDVQVAFQQRAEQTHVLEPIVEAIRPYAQKLALRGVSPAAVVNQLLAVQDLLDNDPVSGVAHVAKVYGVDLRQYATAWQQAQQPQDPALRELQDRVARQDQLIQGWQQAAQAQEQGRINAEVQAFAADTRAYPYFEHVRQRMAELMATGGAASLAQAYRLACADNEQVSAAIAESARHAERRERTTAEKQAADRARRAAVSVSGSPGGSGGGARKERSLRDELYANYDEVATR